MIDNQIRSKFAAWEVEKCLPAAKMVWSWAEVPDLALKEFPMEGYYYKSPELRDLFKRIRNMQQNKELYTRIRKDGWAGDQLAFLKSVYEDEIMGNPPLEGAYPWPDAPMQRRYDIMTWTMQDNTIVNEHSNFPWTIDLVVENVKKHFKNRPNLVELAALIGDPRCLCAGAETNALSRMYSAVSGSYSCRSVKNEYVWEVSKPVQELGEKIVKGYNRVMNNFDIVAPSLDNVANLNRYFEVPRVAHLGLTRAHGYNYFWILTFGQTVVDVYSENFLTTELYANNRDVYEEVSQVVDPRNNVPFPRIWNSVKLKKWNPEEGLNFGKPQL